jgi:hypothetical protein
MNDIVCALTVFVLTAMCSWIGLTYDSLTLAVELTIWTVGSYLLLSLGIPALQQSMWTKFELPELDLPKKEE